MVYTFAIELLWLFSCAGKRHGFPSFGHRYCPNQSQPVATSARCFQKGYLVRINRACSLFLVLSMLTSTVHLADTRPHSPATLAYKSITRTSIIASTHTIYGEADHAPTCVYRLLSSPICQLGSHNIMLSHSYFFPDDAHAPNPPCIIASTD